MNEELNRIIDYLIKQSCLFVCVYIGALKPQQINKQECLIKGSMNRFSSRRGSRISARGGRQENDDLIWDGNERFLTYANTDLQLVKMFIAILCLNGVEQPFKRHQCPFFLPLRRGNPRLRRGSFRPRSGRPPQRPPPWIRA